MKCPACGTVNPTSQRFCGTCGAALVSSDSETIASPTPVTPRVIGDKERYVPGQILAGRYRMVGLLGRGGMGEVYRADDLKLGQPVALKFLPRPVENDPERLQRFLDEVRLSLKVTHPNVCRVFDLGDVDGRHFLSMEYVDGEDLASLLRRIGRLPEDKAVEIARQLCAGLAAAHDEGVLHRDLKPANVMLDGRGRAKITDFGLAGATAGISGREAQAGTPQYMAPEQFEGKELSVQTDIYSLGLVLYELFTGKRAFEGRDLDELKTMHSSAPTSPSAHVSGLNPIVERAILRCVDPDPAKRPRSASALAAALPGGDPLEMAIAAGETPSPEMVAQSGGAGELRIGVAAGYLVTVLAGLIAIWVSYSWTALPNRVPAKPPEELRIAARAIITSAGYKSTPSGSAYGYWSDAEYFAKIKKESQAPDRWNHIADATPPIWGMWYREASGGLAPFSNYGRVSFDNPPVDEAGMIAIRVDPNGQLRSFKAVPPTWPNTKDPWPEPDWTPLFTAAGQTMSEWQESEPVRRPGTYSDLRRAWSKGTLRIEAASMRGKPVWFFVNPDWVKPEDAAAATSSAFDFIANSVAVVFVVAIILGGALLARRNVRLDRSDKRGAQRLATAYLILGAGYEVLRLSGSPGNWLDTFPNNFAGQVFGAAIVWVFYLAIEPYVRRHWPGTLVAWGRVLEGRLRDPLVGRHILIGAMFGVAVSLLNLVDWLAPLFGMPGPAPSMNSNGLEAVSSPLLRLSDFCITIQQSFTIPVSLLLVVLVARLVFRRPWIAYGVLIIVPTALAGLAAMQPNGDRDFFSVVGLLLFLSLVLVILTRVGLFALLVCIVFSFWTNTVLSFDPASWIFVPSLVTMVIYVALAIYGFWASLGQQKLFKELL